MLDLRLFRNARFSAASLAVTALYFCLFGTIFFQTLHLQFVLGYDPLGAGLRSLPFAVVLLIVANTTPRVTFTTHTTYTGILITQCLFALGVAIMGSIGASLYRHSIDGSAAAHLSGTAQTTTIEAARHAFRGRERTGREPSPSAKLTASYSCPPSPRRSISDRHQYPRPGRHQRVHARPSTVGSRARWRVHHRDRERRECGCIHCRGRARTRRRGSEQQRQLRAVEGVGSRRGAGRRDSAGPYRTSRRAPDV